MGAEYQGFGNMWEGRITSSSYDGAHFIEEVEWKVSFLKAESVWFASEEWGGPLGREDIRKNSDRVKVLREGQGR